MERQCNGQSTTPLEETEISFACEYCSRKLTSKSGKTLHQKKCKMKLNENNNHDVGKEEDKEDEKVKNDKDQQCETSNSNHQEPISFMWGKHNNIYIEHIINTIYDEIVFWRKNLFLLPTGSAGRRNKLEGEISFPSNWICWQKLY